MMMVFLSCWGLSYQVEFKGSIFIQVLVLNRIGFLFHLIAIAFDPFSVDFTEIM